MLWKAIKLGVITVAGAAFVGGILLGTDLLSYVRSGVHSISMAVKENIPVDFQLRRARDLLDQTSGEMRRNIRLIASEEVDIASLQGDIAQTQQALDVEKVHLQALRSDLSGDQTTFTISDMTYSRPQLVEQLSQQFTDYKEAETCVAQKRQLLENRQSALVAANQAMQVANEQRAALQTEIDSLEARYRLVQATSVGTDMQLDNSKLSQAESVVGDVRRQLAISEHMLAQEARFEHDIPSSQVNEKDLLTQVDQQLSTPPAGAVSVAANAK